MSMYINEIEIINQDTPIVVNGKYLLPNKYLKEGQNKVKITFETPKTM